ncbi:MAG: hypothetical protein L7V86_08260 [Verrucomicrobiales bacterium]|nr:hypothetical protein [Verrucomicrobiales bacterium]NCF85267.1 hypothetical protein [Verrucomicrobiaceae bacterium]
MASSLSFSPSPSLSQTRMIAGLLVGAFLFLTYRIISIEVAARQGEPLMPAKALVPASTAPQSLPKAIQTLSKPPEEKSGAKPRKRAREGSRREWYERRKRRWFTPPTPKTDTGLPRRRTSFKMA